MEDAFKKLQQDNKNSVDNLIKWMKESKIVDGKKVTEEKVRAMFADVPDASNVELGKFQDVIGKLSNEQNKSVDELCKTLAENGAQFLNETMAAASNALSAAATSFKDALK